jgi:hypothetical protein
MTQITFSLMRAAAIVPFLQVVAHAANLRGLDIDGNSAGGIGIQFNSGRTLNIQKSVIRGFTNSGINFVATGTSTLSVSDTAVAQNGSNGVFVSSNGAGTVNGTLSRVTTTANGVGIFANGRTVNLTITDSVAGNNSYGVGASASAVMVRDTTVSSNAIGISADQAAVIRVGQSTVSANGTGFQVANGGQVQSYGNNNVSGNGSNGALTSAIALQ